MNSIEELFKLYANDVYRFLLTMTRDEHMAEDLLQDTFYKAFINMDAYKEGNTKAWLFTIAKNKFIDDFRKNKRIIVTPEVFKEDNSVSLVLEDIIVTNDIVDDITEIINNLPLNQRKAIILKDFRDLTYEEGAQIMGIKTATFKTLVHRGRKTIRLKYKTCGDMSKEK
ncbi:MAG: RNA polymerase sigma factor [Bacillota bacterium]|uniref:RNA polymerase sigma factor n=1 Tax=unclassified Virgibacillus TaxID=2620237 RepID=UPI001D162E77|nr:MULTISPECIES: sigma-70 family RNA polymerase sigma factor [unclassified Virgibacillus]MCC2251465.1 sigma-70 family RNA polymerase sigma factor [Virgibacillus sp. AGTR]MDY7044864.1 sigma-70 family RNA polymerase sigma factor [Virgibacillus sp. M23]